MAGPDLAMSRTPESNKDVIRRLLAEVDRGNLAIIEACYDPSYVDHAPSAARSVAPGRQGVRQAFAAFLEAFPDARHTIDDLIAEGDRVAARITARGTHTGPLFGHPPTGRVVAQTNVVIYRFVDGRIVERWAGTGAGVLEQLGIEAPPAALA